MIAAWWLIGAATSALIAGLLASLVLAISSLSRLRIASKLQDNDQDDEVKRIRTILDDTRGHAAAVTAACSVFQLTTALCLVFWVSTIRHEPSPTWIAITIGLVLALAVQWIVSTLIPMGVAHHIGDGTIIALARLIRAIHAIFIPLLPIWRFTDEVVRRLAGDDKTNKDTNISVTDLRSIVEDTESENSLDEVEREMLEAVVEFRSTSVEQIMTPRTEINALEYTDNLEEVQAFINKYGHSRHPVFSENLDHIEGMLYAKDILNWIINHGNDGKPFILSEILRDPSFVPETKTVRELLTQLLADQVHIAIILDEYGGTSGLVTMEDIVEEIFGDIQDEYDDAESVASVEIDIDTQIAEIDARTEIDDANDELDSLNIQLPETDDYDTVGGFINTILGRIPEQGEEFTHEEIRFEILEAEPTRVLRLRVSPAPESAENSEENKEQNKD